MELCWELCDVTKLWTNRNGNSVKSSRPNRCNITSSRVREMSIKCCQFTPTQEKSSNQPIYDYFWGLFWLYDSVKMDRKGGKRERMTCSNALLIRQLKWKHLCGQTKYNQQINYDALLWILTTWWNSQAVNNRWIWFSRGGTTNIYILWLFVYTF